MVHKILQSTAFSSMFIEELSARRSYDRVRYNNAEMLYYINLDKKINVTNNQCALVSEIAKAREHIKNSLEKMDGITTLTSPVTSEILERLANVESTNSELRKLVENLNKTFFESQNRIAALETLLKSKSVNNCSVPAEVNIENDDLDLFASDSEDENEKTEILKNYAAKKSKKPAIIAKSSVLLDVKPWDDETDLKSLENEVRKISADGLLWGASKLVPIAFGIQKLTINCVVEDEKISIDWLSEEIEKLEDYVQSVDVAAFNKI